ncbi:MAG: glycoside hydrolase family 2 TIM barrel-domain containing protein [Bullifex sp.]|nr:glycoside hydrolase family 2 TIM barrel-domain containing protein [Bullifex sp.]
MNRNAYPRPQFQRDEWVCLNGEWTYTLSRKSFCYRNEDINPRRVNSTGFDKKINVPFAPETELSGAMENELINGIYYHRKLEIPSAWENKKILLHFGAVFYHAEVYIDGKQAGFHDGGSSSFTVDITGFVKAGAESNLVVKATADLQDGSIPSGKQSSYISSYECFYQRTTGIWQSVWMEAVSPYALKKVKTVWNESTSTVCFSPEFYSMKRGLKLCVTMRDKNGRSSKAETAAAEGIPFFISVEKPELWEPGKPDLYSIEYVLYDGEEEIDRVSSYMGLRTIMVEGNRIFLNGKMLYLRLVLDQGFYPEGNWTAPGDEALENDIKLSMAAGFNGARLHQKVFEERFFYHADRLGYLVWAESPSWGLDYNDMGLPARNFLAEWREIVERDVNHPSIIAWTPLNETFYFRNAHAHRRLHKEAYDIVKSIDTTRPVNDSSGYIHYITDLWTVHTYEQDPEKLRKQLEVKDDGPFRNYPAEESEYSGQPYLVDEYGGVKWDPETQSDEYLSLSQNLQSWGYGQAPRGSEEYLKRVKELTQAILSLPHITGYCYTQLTDVEQEKNGLYFYDRKPKFSPEKYYEIFSRKRDEYDL